MKNYSENTKKLREEIENADALVIGIGAGMSAASGFDYSGERFEKTFGDFQRKYGISDMYSGGTAMKTEPESHMKICWRQLQTKTGSSSQQMWITRYRKQVSIRVDFSTHRVITAFSSAQFHVISRHMTILKL